MIIWFTAHQTTPSQSGYSFKTFLKTSLLLIDVCGIQFHPPNSSDDLCILFCLFLLLWGTGTVLWSRLDFSLLQFRLHRKKFQKVHIPPYKENTQDTFQLRDAGLSTYTVLHTLHNTHYTASLTKF